MYYVTDTALSARFPIYTRANVGEVFPDPVTPLTSDTALWLAELGWRDAWGRMGAFELDEFPADAVLPARRARRVLLPQRLADPPVRRTGTRAVVAGDGRAVLRRPARDPRLRGAPGGPAAGPDGEARRDVRVGVRTDQPDRSRPPDRSPHDDDRAAGSPARSHRDVRAPAVGALRAPPAGAPGAVRRAHLHVVHGLRAGGRDQHHRRLGRAARSRVGRARRHR